MLVQGYLPDNAARTRPELPGCVMLAALPHRRIASESPARASGVAELFCPNSVPNAGFTLIEISIVLVVIGLIIGGVLGGQELIRASEVRAQISQIERYNSATNTFRGKFNAIPGDMPASVAQQFGFTVGSGCNGSNLGQRDGNGLLDGHPDPYELDQGIGETALFWQDLSSTAAGSLIDGSYPNGGMPSPNCISGIALSGTLMGTSFPSAKIGRGNYVYVYETSGANWFGILAATSMYYSFTSTQNIPVSQAYSIDKKIDDGLPQTGSVQATYTNQYIGLSVSPTTPTSGGTSSSCYDTTTSTYSITQNNGSGTNCALSFKMQGAGP